MVVVVAAAASMTLNSFDGGEIDLKLQIYNPDLAVVGGDMLRSNQLMNY